MVKISVIIATYDRQDQIRKCLAALEASDFPRDEFEVIVVDDGSREANQLQLPEFSGAVQLVVIRQANAGAAAARNAGARSARGDFLAFLDDDCLPAENWVRAMYDRLARQPDCVAGGRTVNAAHNNVYARVSHLLTYKQFERYESDPASVRFLTSNNLAISKQKFLHDNHGFNEGLRPAYEDREFCDRLLQQTGHSLVYAPEAVVAHDRVMTLRSFVRQHIRYGRGAYSYHQVSRGRRAASGKRNLAGFLVSVMGDAARGSRGADRLWAPILVGISQMASLIGFAWAVVESWKPGFGSDKRLPAR